MNVAPWQETVALARAHAGAAGPAAEASVD